MVRLNILVAILLAAFPVCCQVPGPTATEDSLFRLFERFPALRSTGERQHLDSVILQYMQEKLAEPESFTYRFDSLRKRVGILAADDGKFRIFTWNVPLSAWEHEYHGVIQVYDDRDKTVRVHVLVDRLQDIPDLLHARTGEGMWPGALYYDLRREKHGGEVIYTLMGFNFNDRWSDKKIIDVLYFDSEMDPQFGKAVFNTPSGIQHRVVFEYSGEVAMNLRYNPDLKMIVYDHLSPIEPELKDHPRFYAPDFSYDGYKFRKGMWEHQSDVDVRNR
jgi:hypothetical protein